MISGRFVSFGFIWSLLILSSVSCVSWDFGGARASQNQITVVALVQTTPRCRCKRPTFKKVQANHNSPQPYAPKVPHAFSSPLSPSSAPRLRRDRIPTHFLRWISKPPWAHSSLILQFFVGSFWGPFCRSSMILQTKGPHPYMPKNGRSFFLIL